MAPEQIDKQSYGKKIDIYACGITAFYLLAGHHPLYNLNESMDIFRKKITTIDSDLWQYPAFISP